MIKLERIHVKNYKNIAEADLQLGQMNVVVGENNAGKSNLLEVIPLLNYIINGPVNDVKDGFRAGGWLDGFGDIGQKGNPRFGSPMQPTPPIIIEIEFSNTDTNTIYNYQLELQIRDSTESIFTSPLIIAKEVFTYKTKTKTGKSVSIFSRENNSVKYGGDIKKVEIINNVEEYSSVVSLLSIIHRSENIPKEYKEALTAFSLIITSDIFYFSPHLFKEDDSKFENKNRIAIYDLDKAIEYLESFTKDWVEYLFVLKNILNIEGINLFDFPNNNKQKKTAYFLQNGQMKHRSELSDGAVVLLALITMLFTDDSDTFFIEEPENSIHPRALSELMKLIRKKSLDKQFIITTHSSYLLNMIKPEEVFVAEINKDGRSEIGKLPDVKAIKKKLAKDFMDFGDIVFSEPDKDEDGE